MISSNSTGGHLLHRHLVTIGILVLLCGCARVGNNFDSRQVAEIRKGETTEADLVRMFGQPMQRGLNSETGTTLTWIYTEARVKGRSFIPIAGAFVGGANTKSKVLSVNLDQSGKVATFTYSGGATESSGTIQEDPETATRPKEIKSPKGT